MSITNSTVITVPAENGRSYTYIVQATRTTKHGIGTVTTQIPTFVLPANLGLSTPDAVSAVLVSILGFGPDGATVTVTAVEV